MSQASDVTERLPGEVRRRGIGRSWRRGIACATLTFLSGILTLAPPSSAQEAAPSEPAPKASAKAAPPPPADTTATAQAPTPKAASTKSTPDTTATKAPQVDGKSAVPPAGEAAPSEASQADAADGSEGEQSADDFSARLLELEELVEAAKKLRAQAQSAVAEERELLLPQLEEADEKLWAALSGLSQVLGQEPPAEVEEAEFKQAKSQVANYIVQEERRIVREFDAIRKELVGLGAKVDGAEDAEKAALREQQMDLVDRVPVLLAAFDGHIDAREALGQSVGPAVDQLKKRLEDSAQLATASLHRISDDLEHIAASADGQLSEDQASRKAVLLERRTRTAELQKRVLALMDKRGLDTAKYRQDLIRFTGEVTEDILNAEVAKGLLANMQEEAMAWIKEHAISFTFKVVSFLLIVLLFAGLGRLAKWLARRAVSGSTSMSHLASDFFVKSVGRVVMLVGWIVAAAQVGIEVGPLLAGLCIAGFVIGFALQSTLSNFASGMMILVYRPFDVGDVVEAGGVMGTVDAMNLVSTSIVTFDNQMLVVPNTKIWGDVIRNLTHQEKRRVDLVFGIGYSDDIDHAEQVLKDVLAKNDKVLAEPEPVVRLHELGDSSVNFVVRPWVKTADYWLTYWEVTREVKRRFDEEGITIPFPQRDLHIHQVHPQKDDRQGEREVTRSQIAPPPESDERERAEGAE